MMNNRFYGILMPISSLPSDEGIGTLGKGAYDFIDYLGGAGASVWQVLPLNPTNYGDSPYQSCSSNALNYYFIDLYALVGDGLLSESDIAAADLSTTPRRVDYNKQFNVKLSLLRKAYEAFDGGAEFEKFVKDGEFADFSVFMALKTKFNHVRWTEWQEPYRTYAARTVREFVKANAREVRFWQFTQYIFLKQWNKLRAYAGSRGIRIMGDIPLYVAYDSAEVWKYGNKLFKMDKYRNPRGVAGVPPDAFSDDGQLWGNPVYDWKKMAKGGFEWWNARIDGCFKLFDILRIDHFRGFDRYFEVPAGEKTAINGKWQDGPKETLFADKLGLDIVAEDLGVADDSLARFMENVGYPGMKVLGFALDGDRGNPHKPSNYTRNCVCYTGTHDNMPLKQYLDDLEGGELNACISDLIYECAALGVEYRLDSAEDACETIIELAFASVAYAAIIPMWDVLKMGGEARINFPSTVTDKNWSWRFVSGDFTVATAEYLYGLAEKYDRLKK